MGTGDRAETPNRQAQRYAPFYCEENVVEFAWARRALHHTSLDGPTALPPDHGAVFISNPGTSVVMREQRAGRAPSGLVVWDYHVIYVEGELVYDLDTTLPFPVRLDAYGHASFPALSPGSPYLPRFSFVQTDVLLAEFSSDRSHMLGADGEYTAPPPPWPARFDPALGNTLFDLVDGTHPAVTWRGATLGGWRV
ncbi:MAG: hypothetical protein ACOC1I_04180 [Spirochaetota bacterium]